MWMAGWPFSPVALGIQAINGSNRFKSYLNNRVQPGVEKYSLKQHVPKVSLHEAAVEVACDT